MKQMERKAVAIGNDCATIQECSNTETKPIPRLVLHSSQYAEEGVMFPSASIMFYGEGVRTLYEFLHDYYANAEGHASATKEVVKHLCGHLRGVLDMLGTCDNFDHHGYCQSHFVESPCRVAKAREFLESLSNTEGESRAASARTVQPLVGGSESK